MNDMEKAILEMIEQHYKKKYVGGIKVTKLGRGWAGYKLVLDLGIPEIRKITISADLEAEDFLKYVEDELINRQLYKVKYFTGIKKYPEDEQRRTCTENQ